jgi:fructose-1,6-bisphosphatase/inositol monophosphatase family enzyme
MLGCCLIAVVVVQHLSPDFCCGCCMPAEKIWDHCAGFCIVEEAGGKVRAAAFNKATALSVLT